MASPNFQPGFEYDSLSTFEMGMNSGNAPLLIPKNQLCFATNVTVRGDFPGPRAPYRKIEFTGTFDETILGGPNIFQGMQYYKPDTGDEQLTVSINGRLFVMTPSHTLQSADMEEIPIQGGPNPATQPQAWMWQAEKWIILNDGLSLPVFYDGSTQVATAFVIPAVGGTVNIVLDSFDNVAVGQELIFEGFGQAIITAVGAAPTTQITIQNQSMAPVGGTVPVGTVIRRAYRSNYGTPTSFAVLTAAAFTVPAIGATVSITMNAAVPLIPVGALITITGCGIGRVLNNGAAPAYTVENVSMAPIGLNNFNNVVVSWQTFGTQLPPGRMGAYVMGRVWESLTDGKQFIAGDIVGGPSGTAGDNFRDAVLNITENTYLIGGGNFAVPGSVGDIRAMLFVAQLDQSLGQGPLIVVTPNAIFSCQSPVDRLTWASVTNPILTVSAIANGGLGQWSTINLNSDIFMRAVDGVRTQQMSRRDFHTWSNTPISYELNRILPDDDNELLRYSSAVYFDNRMLMTTKPEATDRGVIHRGLIAMNCTPVSTLGGKQPPVWDGLWTGLDVLQVVTGEFGLVERCFAFCLNRATGQFELWEIMPTPLDNVDVFDNIQGNKIPITWSFETSLIFRPQDDRKPLPLKLEAGELFIDGLKDTAQIQVFWRPDSETCWQPWSKFSICESQDVAPPGYRSRIGFGEPNNACEQANNKPYRTGFWFQLKYVITGSLSIKKQRFQSSRIPDIAFAQPAGCCPGEEFVEAST